MDRPKRRTTSEIRTVPRTGISAAILDGGESGRRLVRILEETGQGWFLSPFSPSHLTLIQLTGPPRVIRGTCQEIAVLDTAEWGRCLVLDGKLQLAAADEFIYHEMLVHPAALLSGGPRRALVLGGGDGCAARELLRYPGLERADVVDLDGRVIEVARSELSSINEGSLDHPKVRVHVHEAFAWLKTRDEARWDLVLADLTDPFDCQGQRGELTAELFGPAFYDLIKRSLAPGGVFVIQTGGLSLKPGPARLHAELLGRIGQAFGNIHLAWSFVPSFEEPWSVVLASMDSLRPLELDVAARVEALGLKGLRYYDPTTHLSMFHPPLNVRPETSGS